MKNQRLFTNLELAKECKSVLGCYKCPERVKKECLKNECWKSPITEERTCPAVYYGLIPNHSGNKYFSINYEKIAKHLQICGWISITDISLKRDVEALLKGDPPFKNITVYGIDSHHNQVAYTIDLSDIENYIIEEES